MVRYCCFIFFISIQFSNGFVFEKTRNVDECVKNILQRTELINITDATLINLEPSLVKLLHTSLLDRMRFVSRTFYWPNNTLFNGLYIIQCVDYSQFTLGMDMVRRDSFWNPRVKFIIIMEKLDVDLRHISISLMYNYVYDVAVITYDDDDDVEVYAFGVERDECDRPAVKSLQRLSYCSELQETKNIYSSSKKTSLEGCHVKFISHNYWPFVSFNDDFTVERILLSLVKQYENITIELVDYGQIEKFGVRLENYTHTGMLHEIEIYNVEGAVGGYVLNLNRIANLDFIYPYIVDHYRVVIAQGRRIGKWKTVVNHLGLITLCIVLGTFCVCCALVSYMETFRSKEQDTGRDVLIVWGYFFNNIALRKGTKTGLLHRFVLWNILFFVFILTCAIQASLLSTTTHPYRFTGPSTVQEVLSNYELILSPNLDAYIANNPLINTTNSKHICTSTFDCIAEVMNHDGKLYYTLASDIYHESYMWNFTDNQGNLMIRKMSESVETLLQTIYIRRGSSLAGPMNRVLSRVRSTGLIVDYFDWIHYLQRVKRYFNSGPLKRPQSLKGLIGVYMLLTTVYVIAFIVFILELWCGRKKW